jgi:uncharacterized membrane protein
MKTFAIKEALGAGWKAFTANLSVFVAFGVMMLAIWFVEQVGISIAGISGPMKPVILALVTVATRVAQIWLQLALFRMALKLADGQTISTDDFLRPSGDFLGFLLASVLYGLVVSAGMILLVVPGIIWAVRYGAFGFVVADEHTDPVAALKRSAVLTEGVRWELFVFGLAIIGVNIVGAMALGVGLMATIPVTAVATARIYRQLVARAGARTTTSPPAPIGRPAEAH